MSDRRLDVADAVRRIEDHVAAAEPFAFRGEIVEASPGQWGGSWLTVADDTEALSLLVPSSLGPPAARSAPTVVAATGSLQVRKASSGLYIRATALEILAPEGPLSRRPEQHWRELQAQGLVPPHRKPRTRHSKNREIRLPPLKRVAVLTSKGGAGWGDLEYKVRSFVRDGLVEPRWIRLEREAGIDDLSAELNRIDPSEVSAVVIVRGGGSWAALRIFDDLRVAEAIAGAPVPVLTAVGHRKHLTLADQVATWSVTTPADAGSVLELGFHRQGIGSNNAGRSQLAGQGPFSPTGFRRAPATDPRIAVLEAEVSQLRRDLLLERDRRAEAQTSFRKAIADVEAQERAYARLRWFTDGVVLSVAEGRVRLRAERWTGLYALGGYLVLVVSTGPGFWRPVGLLAALLAAVLGVYCWRGPRRANRPASARAMRKAPAYPQPWAARADAARTPRALRVLRSSRPSW